MNVNPVLEAFGIDSSECEVSVLSGGLINATWKIDAGGTEYILQRVNDAVFRSPEKIDSNISRIAQYLKAHHPEYDFVAPLRSADGLTMVHTGDSYFRLMPFVKDSVTIHTVLAPEQAFQAARQFGKFTKLLAGFDAGTLQKTIPDFHNLTLRHNQFQQALSEGNAGRIRECANAIASLQEYSWIVKDFEKIRTNPGFHLRVTHHDTKISNVLFDRQGRGICVIDLDTVMPGYFISDYGDMIRTYVSPANEEESDFSKISVRKDVLAAIRTGYLEFLSDELTGTEKAHLHYSGMFMTYMQALRFLTDHLNDDVYYGARYQGHNRVRALNQVHLLNALNDAADIA